MANQEKKKPLLIPHKDNFSLKKVKVKKNFEGVEVLYSVYSTVKEIGYEDNYSFESARPLHNDFKKEFKKLQPVVARFFNATAFKTLVETKDFSASVPQKQMAQKLAELIQENYDPRSFSLHGKGDKLKVIISSQYKSDNGSETNVNTANLSFAKETYGFESELEEVMQRLEHECYDLIFGEKTGEVTLFNPEPDAAKDPVTKDPEQEVTAADTEKSKKGKNSDKMPVVVDPAEAGDVPIF